MDSRSTFDDLVTEISSRLETLGLHQLGPASMSGFLHDEDPYDDDDDDDEDLDDDDDDGDDGTTVEEGLQNLADRLKASEANAVVHLTFGVNKLAWTDRVLYPEKQREKEAFAQLTGDLGEEKQALAREIARRIKAGEEVVDMLDLFTGSTSEPEDGDDGDGDEG